MPAGSRAVWLILAMLFALPATSASASGEGATWSQFQGNAAHTGSIPGGVEPPLEEAWRVEFPGASSPVADGDAVYSVGRERVIAVNQSTGKELWSVPRDAGPGTSSREPGGAAPSPTPPSPSPSPARESTVSPSVPAVLAGAPAPPPAIVHGSTGELVFTAGSGADTSVVAVDLEDPKRRRELAVLGAESLSGVTAGADLVFVGDVNGVVYAIDLVRGGVVWKKDLGVVPVVTPPVLATEALIAVNAGERTPWEVVALSPRDGRELWRAPIQTQGYVSGASVSGDRVLVGADGVGILAFSLRSGEPLWEAEFLAPPPPLPSGSQFWGTVPASAGGRVYMTSISGGILAVSASDGSKIWDYQLGPRDGPIWSGSPIVVGSNLFVGSQGGGLVAVNESGRGVWRGDTGPGALLPAAATSDLVVVGKTGDHGGLLAFRHDPDGRLTSLESPTTVRPAALLGNFLLALLVVLVSVLLVAGGIRAALERRSRVVEATEDENERGAERKDEGT